MSQHNDLMAKLVSLCKRRGFVFQSSEIYGGLKSCYDYGPLGSELKRNIANEWWQHMVQRRDDIVGIDASIMMSPRVWEASGHLAGFSDPLVDCRNCKERFRADKAPKAEVGQTVKFRQGGKKDAPWSEGPVGSCGYICPNCGSPDLSGERQFNLMFRTSYGPIDPISELIDELDGKTLKRDELRQQLDEAIKRTAVYLRPETAQAMFVQFLNVQQTTSLKVPFGIAQIGKSFRNEIITEHFIFRSCEFEQMEMEFFCEPGSQKEWHEHWVAQRLDWWRSYANQDDSFRARAHDSDELAHYSDACYDIEYAYPWGWDELEGVASRTDYDLKKHAAASGTKLSYFDPQKPDPNTGKPGWRYVPYVIEPAAGLTRAVLCFLADAYTEQEQSDASGNTKTRVFLKLDARLAPYKAAVLPLLKKDGQPELAESIAEKLRAAGLQVSCDPNQSIGKRYAKHDEIGTPFCITVDGDSLSDHQVTVRDRDSCAQQRIAIDQLLTYLNTKLGRSM